MRKKLVCLVLTIAAVLSVSAMVGCSKDTPSIVQPPQSEYTVTYELNGGTGITPIETPKKSGETFYLAASTGFEKDCTSLDQLKAQMDGGSYEIQLSPTAAFQVRTAGLLKRALKEIHALGGDYVSVLTREGTE